MDEQKETFVKREPVEVQSPIKKLEAYRVGLGDTLKDIALQNGTSVDTIIRNNKTAYPSIKPNFIVMGWILMV